jgi:hypothetical protein
MKPCTFTQNYGYKHKRKSLEEILRSTTKKESELIGYDEEPINVEDDIDMQMNNLLINGERTSIQSTAGDNKVDKNDANSGRNNKSNVVMQNGCLPRGATDKINQKEYHGMVISKLHFLSVNYACHLKLRMKHARWQLQIPTNLMNM